MLDNDVLDMTPGEALLDIPMADIIERMGIAIAEAQVRLDEMSMRIAVMLGETRLDMRRADGTVVARSLLELGFTPSFYHFTETKIEVKVSLTIRVSEEFTLRAGLAVGNVEPFPSGTGATGGARPPAGGTGRPAGPAGATGPSPAAPTTTAAGTVMSLLGAGGQRASVFGLTLSADYTRRYSFETTASSSVNATMVSVPAPTVFMNALRQSFGLPLSTP